MYARLQSQILYMFFSYLPGNKMIYFVFVIIIIGSSSSGIIISIMELYMSIQMGYALWKVDVAHVGKISTYVSLRSPGVT